MQAIKSGKTLAAVFAAVLLIGGAGPVWAQAKTKVNVYTALEADQIKAYKEAFERAYPDIEMAITRDSTGIVTAKLLAEKNNPQADVVWGVAATSLLVLDAEGMLEPYAPKGLDAVKPFFRDPRNPPHWVGMDVWAATLCFNTVEAAKKNIPKPESWADLTKPIYKGQIVMPNPASSGTGFLDVSSWLQMMGDGKGWAFMDEGSRKGFFSDLATKLPARRIGTPRDLAEAALFALTNRYPTGEVVHVHGGGSLS